MCLPFKLTLSNANTKAISETKTAWAVLLIPAQIILSPVLVLQFHAGVELGSLMQWKTLAYSNKCSKYDRSLPQEVTLPTIPPSVQMTSQLFSNPINLCNSVNRSAVLILCERKVTSGHFLRHSSLE